MKTTLNDGFLSGGFTAEEVTDASSSNCCLIYGKDNISEYISGTYRSWTSI